MRTKSFFGMLFMTLLMTMAMTACGDDDEPQDSSKDIIMYVSEETDIMGPPYGAIQTPVECLLVKEEGSNRWQKMYKEQIQGFTYENGHAYTLKVRKTILANPPADGFNTVYSLISIIEDKLVAAPEIPVDTDIKSEADIEYYDLCPFEKYAICKYFIVDEDGKIDGKMSYDNVSPLPSYKNARIWLENIMDKGDPNWVKFNSTAYQAGYSYVLSPFTDVIRLVSNYRHGPMFKDVVPENEFNHIVQSMKSGEEVSYALILANHHKKGLQKLEFVVIKK